MFGYFANYDSRNSMRREASWVENTEIWNMSLAELLETEYSKTELSLYFQPWQYLA